MIARVVVNHNSKAVDKMYDYLVPCELIKSICTGSKVTIPFGQGNRQREGYVFKLLESSTVENLKPIISVLPGGPVFDEKMLNLISWMREKYLCTYMDIIKAAVPAGTAQNPEEWIVLENKECEALTPTGKEIIKILKENGGECEINFLLDFSKKSARQQIKKMCEMGILKVEYRKNSSVKDKKLKAVSLAIDLYDAMEEIEKLNKKRAFSQAAIIEALMGNEFVFTSELINFVGCSYSTVATLCKKKIVEIKDVVITRNPFYCDSFEKTKAPQLNLEQKKAAEEICNAIEEEKYEGFLLHGVTGGGKTEVFMNVISKVLEMKKQAMLLVPEISLTPQMVNRFVCRFGERVAIFHSGLSMGERYDQWKRMKNGEADIVIGARSAIFAPFDNIGIIIMDEEHEQTYKSELPPRYSTAEVAKYRAKQNDAIFLKASATPSVVSYYEAKNKNYKLLNITKRANEKSMPKVSVVDMRHELEAGNKSIFSRLLVEEIEKNLKNKEQTILFLNRRGFSTFVSCRSCGYVPKCPDCSISLTYHKYDDNLKCHYCGHERKNPVVCPECGSKYIRYFGGGTQKVEEEIKRIFPDCTTLRMDVDTTGRKFAHEKILEEFEKNHVDILIGTQMVAKGLDFENVTLVGVVSADTMLNLDDFRSGERSFSLLEQVTGRAGRAKKEGRAIVQTYSPEHSAIEFMRSHSYEKFYDCEIKMRKAMYYPPYCEMVMVMFSGENEKVVSRIAQSFKKSLGSLSESGQKTKVLGPIASPMPKIKKKYRYQMLIKCENADLLNEVLHNARQECQKRDIHGIVSIVIDKNPNGII